MTRDTFTMEVVMSSDKVIDEVIIERIIQDEKWGEQNHNPIEWMSILMEEVGEASQAALDTYFKNSARAARDNYRQYRKEMIQVAAVAVAAIESLDRREANNDRQAE